MDKVLQTLTELLVLQRSQLTIGKDLVAVLEQEEELASDGFSLGSLQEIVAVKDQVIHRFLAAEHKRQAAVRRLCFLIGFDARDGVPSLSAIRDALEVYGRNLNGLLQDLELQKTTRGIDIYRHETALQIPAFELIAQRVSRNKIIVQRLLGNVNSTVRFFEQAFRVVDASYDKGGRMSRGQSIASHRSQLTVKA